MKNKVLKFCVVLIVILVLMSVAAAPPYQDGPALPGDVFGNVMVGVVPLILLTLGLVEFSKQLGVKKKWLLVEAMLVGMLFYGAQMYSDMNPVIKPWLELIVFGLGGGLATSGIYDLVKKSGVKLLEMLVQYRK